VLLFHNQEMVLRKQSAEEPFLLDRIPSPIGTMLVVVDHESHLRVLDWEDFEERMHRMLRLCHGAFIYLVPGRAPGIRDRLESYFAGDIRAIDSISVRTGGTPFQNKVWTALRTIAPGTTLTYGSLARKIRRPTAIRAVGHANGANPVSVVVPCHRLIGADGTLTGYGGGLHRKQWLLAHEGAPVAIHSR
jgi:methylated-DNA-[protein]-cysteine S-methyltransferase